MIKFPGVLYLLKNRRLYLIAMLVYCNLVAYGQNIIDWDATYELQLSDFQASTSQIGEVDMFSLHTSSGMGFLFQMTNAEFMFTKNFNSKVSVTFSRDAASLIAPDTTRALDLLAFARFEFDLSELYARRFRKKLFEEKATFSRSDFYQPVYENIQKEFNERHAQAGKETNVGLNRNILATLHNRVKEEIEELADYCKSCKPPKKVKSK